MNIAYENLLSDTELANPPKVKTFRKLIQCSLCVSRFGYIDSRFGKGDRPALFG